MGNNSNLLKLPRKNNRDSLSQDNAKLEKLKGEQELAIKMLLNALKCKDLYTWEHSLRVSFFSTTLGRELNLSPFEIYELEVSALLHDIGKIGVPDQILLKPSRLDENEFQQMKQHPSSSGNILSDFPSFQKMSLGAKHHHERYDGRGYPDGLKGDNIPLYARIILIADTFDAMTSTRPYRKGLDCQIAYQELRDFSGTQFDPILVEKFITAISREINSQSAFFYSSLVAGEFKKIAA